MWDYESLLFSLWWLAYDFNVHLWNTHIFIATAQTFKAPDSNLTRPLECSKKSQNQPTENWNRHLSSQIWSSSRGPYFTEWHHPPIVQAINWSSTLTPPPPSSLVQLFTKSYWFHFLNCYWRTYFCIHHLQPSLPAFKFKPLSLLIWTHCLLAGFPESTLDRLQSNLHTEVRAIFSNLIKSPPLKYSNDFSVFLE